VTVGSLAFVTASGIQIGQIAAASCCLTRPCHRAMPSVIVEACPSVRLRLIRWRRSKSAMSAKFQDRDVLKGVSLRRRGESRVSAVAPADWSSCSSRRRGARCGTIRPARDAMLPTQRRKPPGVGMASRTSPCSRTFGLRQYASSADARESSADKIKAKVDSVSKLLRSACDAARAA